VGQVLLDQRAIGQCLPGVFPAGDDNLRALARDMDARAENPDGFFKRTRCTELRFVDGIEEEKRFAVVRKPVGKFRCRSDLERIFERGVDRLDTNEEGLGTLLTKFGGAIFCLERLACTGIGQHEDAVVLLELAPSLHRAAWLRMQKLPIAQQWLGRDKTADQGNDDVLHIRVPALAG
jgi:hypothetical protein